MQQDIPIDVFVDNLQMEQVKRGDTVYGILPLNIIADINRCGATFVHINLDVPAKFRGQELTAAQMDEFGAHLQNVSVQLRSVSSGLQHDHRQICLVMLASGEQLQNYLPALFLKPAKAIILSTPTMMLNAARLAEALRSDLPGCIVDVIGGLPETRMEAMTACDAFLRPLDTSFHPVFNITGATKALSGALEEIGRNLGADIFYWHGQAQCAGVKYNNAIEWILPRHDGLISSGLRPGIAAFALLNGYRVQYQNAWIGPTVGTDVIRLAEFLLDPVNKELRHALNKAFFDVNPRFAEREGYPAAVLTQASFKSLAALLLELGILVERDSGWFFNGQHAFELVAQSQWLEVYLLVQLRKCKKTFDLKEITHSLRIQPSSSMDTWTDDGEIDVALMQNDIFWAFECKNVNFSGPGVKLDRALRQIDNYARMVGGKFARKVLFSVDNVQKAKLASLHRLGIDLIQGDAIWPDRVQASLAQLLRQHLS